MEVRMALLKEKLMAGNWEDSLVHRLVRKWAAWMAFHLVAKMEHQWVSNLAERSANRKEYLREILQAERLVEKMEQHLVVQMGIQTELHLVDRRVLRWEKMKVDQMGLLLVLLMVGMMAAKLGYS